jgi:hypothetical protein
VFIFARKKVIVDIVNQGGVLFSAFPEFNAVKQSEQAAAAVSCINIKVCTTVPFVFIEFVYLLLSYFIT